MLFLKPRSLLQPLILVCFLMTPAVSLADAGNVPSAANWYLYVDLKQMRSGGAGAAVYDWLREEVFAEVKEDVGIDLENEFDRLTSYSDSENQAVFVIDGNISQATKDVVMTLIASDGDINPIKSSGNTYFRLGGESTSGESRQFGSGDIKIDTDLLDEEAWISTDVKNKIIITTSERQMKNLLAKKGKVSGGDSVAGALLVLTADKAFVQGGMRTEAVADDDWDSNILRNTEEVAFMLAAVRDKLAIEAELVTKEAEMAESLASVVRGLISLMSFSDEVDADTAAALRDTRVKSEGNRLALSLVIDPQLVVSALGD